MLKRLPKGEPGNVLRTSAPEGYVLDWGCGDCKHRGQSYCTEEDCNDCGGSSELGENSE